MVLALNLGATQIDLATITPEMLHLKADVPYLERPRSKTGVKGRWALWPESVEILKAALKKHRKAPDQPLLRTQKGRRLVYWNKNRNRMDAVMQVWNRLTKACDLYKNGKSFKHLRKTGSQIVRNLKGREFAEAYLAHAENGVGTHYHRFDRWKELDQAILTMREELSQMFEPLAEQDDAHG